MTQPILVHETPDEATASTVLDDAKTDSPEVASVETQDPPGKKRKQNSHKTNNPEKPNKKRKDKVRIFSSPYFNIFIRKIF